MSELRPGALEPFGLDVGASQSLWPQLAHLGNGYHSAIPSVLCLALGKLLSSDGYHPFNWDGLLVSVLIPAVSSAVSSSAQTSSSNSW